MNGRKWVYAAVVAVFSGAAMISARAPQAGHTSKVMKGDAEAGEVLYQRHCVMCHSTEAGVTIVGPSLHGEMKGPHAKTAAQVREQTEVGKGRMPSFRSKLDDQQITDLIAYIRKL